MSDPFDNSGQGTPPPPPPPGTFGGAPSGAPGQGFAPPTQPNYSTPAAGSPSTPNYSGPTMTELTPTPQNSPKRSRGKMIGALVGVAALLGAGTFAVTQISSNDSDGGASSPKEVGDKLVTSLDGEDLLGVVDLLLPGERETFRKPLVDLAGQLSRLQITDEVDLNKVPGFDITIADPEVTTDETNVDDITKVHVTGSATVKVNGDDVPIGKLLIDRVFDGERPEIDDSEQDSDFDYSFTTVKDGGRWYLSLFYSAADAARGDQDIPETGIKPVGADTPDGALDNMVNAIGDLDLEGIIGGLNPNEAAALQRYAPLFIDDAQDELDQADAKISISDAEYKVSGSGDSRQVAVTSIKVTASADDETVEFELKDGCVTATGPNIDENTCSADDNMDGTIDSYLDDLGANSPEVKKLVDDIRAAFSDFDMHGIVVDKVDGKWFVSPIGTGSEYFLSVLRALDRDEIDTIINDGKTAFESLFSGLDDGGYDGTDDTTDDSTYDTTDDSTYDTTAASTYDTTDNSYETSGTGTDTTDDSSYWFDCLTGSSNDVAASCIRAGIDAGEFEADQIPGAFLYPDCGLFDYYNGSDIYSDSPADFQAATEPGRQCVVDAAAKDGVDLTYSSPELLHPECYTELNPYDFSGDSDAYSAAYDCATSGG